MSRVPDPMVASPSFPVLDPPAVHVWFCELSRYAGCEASLPHSFLTMSGPVRPDLRLSAIGNASSSRMDCCDGCCPVIRTSQRKPSNLAQGSMGNRRSAFQQALLRTSGSASPIPVSVR